MACLICISEDSNDQGAHGQEALWLQPPDLSTVVTVGAVSGVQSLSSLGMAAVNRPSCPRWLRPCHHVRSLLDRLLCVGSQTACSVGSHTCEHTTCAFSVHHCASTATHYPRSLLLITLLSLCVCAHTAEWPGDMMHTHTHIHAATQPRLTHRRPAWQSRRCCTHTYTQQHNHDSHTAVPLGSRGNAAHTQTRSNTTTTPHRPTACCC